MPILPFPPRPGLAWALMLVSVSVSGVTAGSLQAGARDLARTARGGEVQAEARPMAGPAGTGSAGEPRLRLATAAALAPTQAPAGRSAPGAQQGQQEAQQGQQEAQSAQAVQAVQAVQAAQAVQGALEVVAQAASAARRAAAAASASAARIALLEHTVEQLRADADAQHELAAQLREQLARASGPSRWLGPLAVLVLLLVAAAVWLAWRLSLVHKTRDGDWRQAAASPRAAAAPTDDARAAVVHAGDTTSPRPHTSRPIALVSSDVAAPGSARVQVQTQPAWPPPVGASAAAQPGRPAQAAAGPVEPALQRTQPLAPAAWGVDSATRDVSIEELIDLEQQAEFFVVLGQDEAAIDLLVEHLRSTGGSSPLPYLKLLEIYRRRGERDTYERMRARFNRRFNAYAPEWDVDPTHGRALEDHADVVRRLQQAWPRPIDAMAELEALLFRRSGGALFDLPAYREVLFLYALARDLLDRDALAGGNVDLLLPLGGDTAGAVRAPYLGLEGDAVALEPDEERLTLPVDLDLSSHERASSIFDPLDETPQRS